jgi:uncharacterized protein (TIGR02300 family)
MTKPELGTKRRCNTCETKFFDLNKDPIVCPKCAAVFAPPQSDPIRSRRPSDRQLRPAQKVAVPKVPNEFLSIDEPDGDRETEAPVADTEEAEAVLLLVDDQDEKLDPAEIIEADIEKDDT